jgi:hypothetical protein
MKIEYNWHDRDESMAYEQLLRRSFHCGRGDDFFHLADADMWRYDDKMNVSLETRIGIWSALKLASNEVLSINNKNRNESEDHNTLSEMADKILTIKDQDGCHTLMNKAHKILNQYNINETPRWTFGPSN